jgi:uncharacterized protein DUF1206
MATAKTTLRQVKGKTERAIDNPWIERLVQLGYVMRGILYVVIGLIAVQVVLGTRSPPPDTNGAIQEIGSQPYGEFLLIAMAIGLIGYSLWGFIRAIWDPLGKGNDAGGLVERLGYLWSGFAYGLLVLPTVQALQGRGSGKGQTAQAQDLSARLMQTPFGVWILGLLGLVIIGVGVEQVYYAYRQEFRKELSPGKLPGQERLWLMRLGQWGYAARGVVFALIGVFLVQAAMTYDPHKAVGLDGALFKLAQQPYGPVLLGLVALGLISFGVFSIAAARVARIQV